MIRSAIYAVKASTNLMNASRSISEQVADAARSLREERIQDAQYKVEQALSGND